MTCKTCPNCGFDLVRVEDLALGALSIHRAAEVRWHGQVVPLTTAERLIVCALARADGAMVAAIVLGEAVGSESEVDPNRSIDVLICRIRKKFRAIDPAFDFIERRMGRHAGGLTRWRVEVPA